MWPVLYCVEDDALTADMEGSGRSRLPDLLLRFNKRGAAGAVAGMGVSVTHRIDFKLVGIAHMTLVVLAVIHTAPDTYSWGIQNSFTTFQHYVSIFPDLCAVIEADHQQEILTTIKKRGIAPQKKPRRFHASTICCCYILVNREIDFDLRK
jgi:hypothetical protein